VTAAALPQELVVGFVRKSVAFSLGNYKNEGRCLRNANDGLDELINVQAS
jgi:hypothetical protein